MTEIKKMIQLRKMATEEAEKQSVSKAMDALEEIFEEFVGQVPDFIRKGERGSVDTAETMVAVKTLGEFGTKYGIEFPEIHNEQELRVYVARYTLEILRSDD